MSKNKFILPLIAILLMLGAFVYIYIDINKESNTYKADTRAAQEAKREAEVAVIFSEIKRELNISYITTTQKEFEWENNYLSVDKVLIKGWRVYSSVDPVLVPKVGEYLIEHNFNNITPKSDKDITDTSVPGSVVETYQRDGLVCILTKLMDNGVTNIELLCGYYN